MSSALSCHIGFLGGGQMAQALVDGLLSRGLSPEYITVADPEKNIRDVFQEKKVAVFSDYLDAICGAEVVVVLDTPDIFSVLCSLAAYLRDKLVISLDVSANIEYLQQLLQTRRVVRAVMNLPAMIQTGAHGMCGHQGISEDDRFLATQVLASTGLVVWTEKESDLNVVSAVSGAGPAYFFYMMESMIRAGRNLGLDEKTATALTLQTALGAAQMAISSGLSPTDLRKKLASAQDETRAALEVFDQMSVSQSIQTALAAAQKCSQALSQELSDRSKLSS